MVLRVLLLCSKCRWAWSPIEMLHDHAVDSLIKFLALQAYEACIDTFYVVCRLFSTCTSRFKVFPGRDDGTLEEGSGKSKYGQNECCI